MSSFPGSPRLQKGALVTLLSSGIPLNVIAFQYNPESLRRSLSASQPPYGSSADPKDALRLAGPPTETIQVDVEFDAADQLEQRNPTAIQLGLHPVLASVELLLYPTSSLVLANQVLLNLGVLEVIPPEVPLTLFVWGSKRVLPVRLTDFSITEEEFDPDLNPIRAKVGLNMTVLTYRDLDYTSIGGSIFLAHHVLKESLAALYNATSGPSLLLQNGIRIPGIGG